MRDLFDHNVVNLADYITWNDRINKLGIIMSVEGNVCENISNILQVYRHFSSKDWENLRKP